jgi:ketosteroid isomerase-like protein
MSTSTLDKETSLVDQIREENLAVARAWMTTISEPSWWGLMHDDIVLEFPYASSVGISERYVGKENAEPYARALFARIGVFHFKDLEVIETTDPSLIVSEYRADMTTPHGEHYVQVYINKLRIQDGKVILMREYWDPKRTIDAMTADALHLPTN